MFDRETRRAKTLEARSKAKRDVRGKSAAPEKTTTDVGLAGDTEMKEGDPIEKAEKDFWKIIEEEKRRRDRKTVLGDEKAAAEAEAANVANAAALSENLPAQTAET